MTSQSQNKLLARRFLEEVVNTGAGDRLPEFLAPEYAAPLLVGNWIFRGLVWEGVVELLDLFPTFAGRKLDLPGVGLGGGSGEGRRQNQGTCLPAGRAPLAPHEGKRPSRAGDGEARGVTGCARRQWVGT
jgi:hypothetical protein